VSIDSLTVGRPAGVLNMSPSGRSEEFGSFSVLCHENGRQQPASVYFLPQPRLRTHRPALIQHGLYKRLALTTSDPDHLGSSQSKLSRLRRFISDGRSTVVHLAISELFDHLNPGVGRDLVFLDEVLAVVIKVDDL
jgi:hypothetical protein